MGDRHYGEAGINWEAMVGRQRQPRYRGQGGQLLREASLLGQAGVGCLRDGGRVGGIAISENCRSGSMDCSGEWQQEGEGMEVCGKVVRDVKGMFACR